MPEHKHIMHTMTGQNINIMYDNPYSSLLEVLTKNRNISDKGFFSVAFSGLHDPFLLPDMSKAVRRILRAKEGKERIVIFGDYDVDGVSGTALLVRYLMEIGCQISYRLPHRIHDGYGLKNYFFDELKDKGVTLVITVDCGTKDIEATAYAKSYGIDVIVTDHHAVPENISDDIVALISPKRRDSHYPFPLLAGAGVAFKLLQGIVRTLTPDIEEEKCTEYLDFASLGTVADCMPLIGENRIITTLGLRQMAKSKSNGLRKFLGGRNKVTENDADIIGFQIGPRINAAGRMDTPIKALQWLLAGDKRADELFEELEHFNEARKDSTTGHFEKALKRIDDTKPILFYDSEDIAHGVIGLVAGKLTEIYGKPTIVLKNEGGFSVASCRSPEWCNIIELLDMCKSYFVRYGGHRQAAGFTLETAKLPLLREALYEKFSTLHDQGNIAKKGIDVDCALDIMKDFTLENLDIIDTFRPFGIGNRKPLFLLQDETVLECNYLGKERKHLELRLVNNPQIKIVAWGRGNEKTLFEIGNIISLIVELERNEWNGKESVTATVKDIIAP